jgi:hypothetical protein
MGEQERGQLPRGGVGLLGAVQQVQLQAMQRTPRERPHGDPGGERGSGAAGEQGPALAHGDAERRRGGVPGFQDLAPPPGAPQPVGDLPGQLLAQHPAQPVERHPRELAEPDGRRRGRGVSLGQGHVVQGERLPRLPPDARLVGGRQAPPDVEGPRGDGAGLLARRDRGHLHRALRVRRAEVLHRRQERASRARGRGDPHAQDPGAASGPPHRLAGVRLAGQQRAGVLQQHPPGAGEGHAPGAAEQQRGPDLFLQVLDLPGKGGLGDVCAPRRAGEVAFLRDGHEVAHVPEIHGALVARGLQRLPAGSRQG